MPNLDAMAQAIDFIEAHLDQELRVADVADAVGYSLYHFSRMFNQVVRHTPYDYLMRRRLSESARALVQSDRLIIDIALDYGFNNPETYSRAFRRMFATTPTQWRSAGRLPPRRMMPRLTPAHLARWADLHPAREMRGPLHLTGLMTWVRECDPSVLPALWAVLVSALAAAGCDPAAPRYGVLWSPGDEAEGAFYLAATAARVPAAASGGLVTKTLPPGDHARFTHRGPWRARHLTLDCAYHTWLPKIEATPAFSWELEHYPQGFPAPDDPDAETVLYVPLAL
jgi:AraC family transcriptional regulator